MALTEDSPPFASLQQSAENFKTSFDKDIGKCLTALNSKITALMCDPDSLGGNETGAKRGNAHVEFSMAKYNILSDMKSLYEEKEKTWLARLEDMKGEFMENVELFLANTKLEVTLPVVAPRVGIRKLPASYNLDKQDKPSPVSSLYPKLFNTAKSIPVLSSLLPKEDPTEEELSEVEEVLSEIEEETLAPPVRTPKATGRTPKRVTICEPYMPSPGQNGASRSYRSNPSIVSTPSKMEVEESENEEEEEEPVVVQTPVKRSARGRKSFVNTPASAKKETVSTPLRRKIAAKKESENDSTSSNEERPAPVIETGKRGRRSVVAQLPAVETVNNSTPGKKGRPSRKKANGKEAQLDEDVMEMDEDASAASGPKTPKQVQFALGLDPNEDLEIYSPDYSISRSAPRRKTFVTHALENFSDINLTPEVTRGKSKRKTFAGSQFDQSVAPSPKRLKRAGGRTSLAPSSSGLDETNLLESEGTSEMSRYSPWIPLSDIGGAVPGQPGVYELKVAAAKKPAYIGGCESLRQKLTLHKLVQSSGHKQLDKFVERNVANILVRYEQMPTAQEAKQEEKNRVKDFVTCYKTTPAYN